MDYNALTQIQHNLNNTRLNQSRTINLKLRTSSVYLTLWLLRGVAKK